MQHPFISERLAAVYGVKGFHPLDQRLTALPEGELSARRGNEAAIGHRGGARQTDRQVVEAAQTHVGYGWGKRYREAFTVDQKALYDLAYADASAHSHLFR